MSRSYGAAVMSTDAPTPEAPSQRRLTALVGVIASAALIGAFFLPLFTVDAAEAGRLADRIEKDIERQSRDEALAKDFALVFRTVTDQAHVTPADLVHYARTARRQRANLVTGADDDGAGGAPTPSVFDRLLVLLMILAAAPAAGGVLLIAYFLFHGLRRVRSPMLILALVIGCLGALFPLAHQYARYEVEPYLGRALGFWLQLAASATLILVALFGVRLTNWWRVYVVGGVTIACLGALGIAYLNGALGG